MVQCRSHCTRCTWTSIRSMPQVSPTVLVDIAHSSATCLGNRIPFHLIWRICLNRLWIEAENDHTSHHLQSRCILWESHHPTICDLQVLIDLIGFTMMKTCRRGTAGPKIYSTPSRRKCAKYVILWRHLQRHLDINPSLRLTRSVVELKNNPKFWFNFSN